MTNYETYLFYIYPDEDCRKGYIGNIYQCMKYFLWSHRYKAWSTTDDEHNGYLIGTDDKNITHILQTCESKGSFSKTENQLLLEFYQDNFYDCDYEGWFVKEADESFYYLLDDDEIMKIGEELESDGELELRNYAAPADTLRPYADSVAIRYHLTDDQKNQLRNQI
jgi:hypothetical protein